MTLTELRLACARAGIRVSAEQGQLRVKAPAGAVTSEVRAALSARKEEFLAFLATPQAELSPLSSSQRSLWLLHQADPETLPAYTLRAARRLHGPLPRAVFTAALRILVARHDPLRTAFDQHEGEPWQRILPSVPVAITEHDVSSRPPAEREAAWRSLLAEEGRRRFDVSAAPLFTVHLVTLGPEEHVLLLNAHHLIADAWSAGLLLREWAEIYAELVSGGIPSAERPTYRFNDYVMARRQAEVGPAAEKSLAHWRTHLAGLPPLAWPRAETPAAGVSRYEGRSADFVIAPSTEQALRALAREEGATLFHVLVAGYAVWLQRLSGQDDFGLGTTLAGRDGKATESLVGYFVNLVVLRPPLADQPSFRELVRRMRRETLAAYDHQATPFDRIVQELRLPREPGASPLFQALFLYLQAARDEASFPGLHAEPIVVPSETAKYALSLHVEDHGDRLTGLVEYRAGIFAPEMMARLLEVWATLLAELAGTPDRPISHAATLSGDARRAVLAQSTGPTAPSDQIGGIAAAFQDQVARTPAGPALVYEDRALTYAELDRASEHVAQRLRAAGVGAERRVGVLLERGVELVATLLGVLKAGGAYVPMDPAYPEERLRHMVEDARPVLVVTRRGLAPLLPSGGPAQLLVDELALDVPLTIAAATARPDQPAYVIYTSGSTGKPKGVAVTHGNAINFFAGMDAQLGRNPGVWLALTSISFDISVLELFWTLARGFKVVLQGDEADLGGASTESTDAGSERPLDFSLFFFAGDAARQETADRYRLVLEGARFADERGFAAVWTPERHFHAFGGLFPNPSVLGGALAMITRRVALRAGSVVLPLHDPIRVAEEWSVVDNLSGGRVGLSFASGWHQHDFVLSPEDFAERRRVLFSRLQEVRDLWRGDALSRADGKGEPYQVRTLPRPVQPELPAWITSGGDPETLRLAGESGAGLLTHLLGQTVEDLAGKIAIYRAARRAAGHPGEGHVVVMLHTFIGDSVDEVRARVRGPFREYLRSAVDLIAAVAKTRGLDLKAPGFSAEDFEVVLDHAFERYFGSAALMGTPTSCQPLLRQLRTIGVDEVACLIDFGVDDEHALAALRPLEALRERHRTQIRPRRSLAEQFARHRPTHFQATPSRLKMLLLDPAVRAGLARLDVLIAGGEALPAPLARELQAEFGGRLHNLYGPTETTVWSTGHALAPGEDVILVGRPLVNQTAYVLDPGLQPVPDGVAGELFLGGDGVTRGYLGRPELTADRFLPDPFAVRPGARMYRTGDLARWRAGGQLECLGRVDHQVKILGHRIEPGEIEAAIASHPDVRAAAVTAPRGPDGEPRLVAYFVPRGLDAASALRPESLRAWLRERMPSYLVPAICVQLAAMPQTPNGKIDRKALPAPDAEAMPAGPYVAPRTPAEARVAAVWCELLQRPQVGVEENFFEVGGHSLLAMQLIARLRAELGADLSLRAIFEGPTIAAIAARVAPTREAGGSAAPKAASAAAASLPAREPGPLPLSLGQRRLWFIEQLEPGRSTYHVPAAIRLRGACVPTALEQSFADLVRRHEALRTRFPVRDGEPFQDILPADDVRFVLQCDDLRSLPPTEREERARVVAGETAVAAFDLAGGPVIRARLIQLAEDDHLLVVVVHHIVSDGWTINLITRELTACYAARVAGAEPQLPRLTAHYADFAQWQRHQHSDAQLRASLDFWRSYLLGGVAAEIPADRPRPRALDGVGQEYRCRWPRSLTAGLNHLAQREGATLFMALLAGYAAVLARHSRQDDLVLGTSVANRPRPEFEAMAGFFVNLLPVRVDLQGDPTFGDVMRRVKQSCLAGYAHQATSFESLIDAVAPVRDLSRTPIFQTLFVLLNTPPASARLAGLEITPVPLANRTAKFDVTLIAEEVEGELLWVAEYRTELYEEETLRRLLGHLRILLEAAVARPDVRLSALPLLAEDELAAQSRWSRSEVPFPPGPWIHEQPRLVAPDSPALASSAGTLTYGEFNRRADALAARLQAHGVGPESRVAVCLERSPELVLALHAVLRAGGAYVPLDPDYPAERLAYMLADAAPVLVVTTEALAARLGVPSERTLRMESALFAPTSPALRVPVIAGLGAAYMIYTSGSTGRPKGAVNTHAAILNRLQWMQAALPLTTADRVLQKTPYSFDVSVWEFFWPLMTGATLVVADPGVHKDPAQLIELIVAERVTTLHFVPSMLRAFLETPGVERCTAVRQIVCSGEELPRDLVVMAHDKLPGAAVHNLYGPTEAAVDVSWHACRRGESGPVPIGGPIANVELHVLDAHLRPVPVGVPGEVYLGGVGLGRGYHGQPALTAERWVPDPAPRTPGARLYRTGDLGRWRPDGEIEYLGRLDFQVKLRGLRIELGEIDAALRDHADVADAVCALRQDAPAGARIVAYVVVRGATPTAAVLRTWLGERLPDYMVPTAWVFLAALPLSPAGKVDRRALPAPQVDRVAERVAPRDGDEETVLAIWREVLGREDLGMTDDFFEVGGHSLVATRVMTRLRERAGVTLPLRVLFQHPTAAALAAALRAERARGAAPIAAGALRRASRERRAVAISADGEIAVSAPTNGGRRG